MGVDYKRALTFFREDPDFATKLALGGLIALVPILNFAGLGYALNLFRNVVEGRDSVLPDWSDLGDHFFKGLPAVAVALCYAAVFAVAYLVLSIPTAFSVLGGSLVGRLAGGVLTLLVFTLGSALTLQALALYAEDLEVGAAFRFGVMLERFRDSGPALAGIVGLWVAGSILAAAVSWWVPFVGPVLGGAVSFASLLAVFHALGDLVRDRFHPELRDPLAWTPTSPPQETRPGTRKASDLVERPSNEVLTWSTDSDEAER